MKSFLNACGFREPLRLWVEGPRTSAEPRVLAQPFAVLGRDPRADVILDDLKVSRRHVYLQAVAGEVFWVDLESRTGTSDETGTRKWGWLSGAGGLLQVGPFVIRRAVGEATAVDPRRREADRESPLAVRALGREPLPEVALEFLNGPSQAATWPMNRVMSLVGSAQGCKFRLTDPSVSAFHAGLIRTPTGLWVVDLRGGRSLSVNGEPVRFVPLSDGDVLGIGRYRMRVRCREAVAAGPEPVGGSSAGWTAPRAAGALARRPAIAAATPAVPALSGPLLPMPPAPPPVVASAVAVELVAADGGAHPGLRPDVAGSALAPLVEQFGLMQQQMFDQFQQAMGMLVQMFTSMHRDQMDVIREELDRLHDLSRELQDLKEELALAREGAGVATGPAPVAAAPPAPAVTAAPGAGVGPDVRAADVPAAGATGPRPAVAAAGPRRPSPPFVTPPPRPSPAPPPGGLRPDRRPPGVDPTGVGVGPQDAVAWIHQRIAAIQAERETRWQKILKLLPGMS